MGSRAILGPPPSSKSAVVAAKRARLRRAEAGGADRHFSKSPARHREGDELYAAMDELHDAIQDAQYIGAVTNAHRGPSAAFYAPTQSELAQFVDRQERTHGQNWLALESLLDLPLGFYFFRRFCEAEQHGVLKLDFLVEVTKFRALSTGEARVAQARDIYERFCCETSTGASGGGSSATVIKAVSSPSHDGSSAANHPLSPVSPAMTASTTSPQDDRFASAASSSPTRSFSLGHLDELNLASITTRGVVFWHKNAGKMAMSDATDLYKANASESSPIGVGGEVVRRIASVLKRKQPGGELANSPVKSESRANSFLDFKNFPPTLFDELEACVLCSLAQLHYQDFRSSVFYKRLIVFLYLQTRRVSEDDFTVLRILGRGGFGMVNGCIKRTSASLYAMKVMNKKMIKKKHAEKLCLAERKILSMIASPFVVCLKYAFQSSDELFLVLDLRTGGDLSFHLNRSRFTEHQVRFWAAQILLGLQHLHEKNIVYRDLKPENILLDEKGNCCISDLGLAVEVTPTLAGRCGTRGYWAPEMLLRDENGQRMVYNQTVDWWSYGCLVYELLYGKCPFRTSKAKALHEDKQQAYDKATLELTPSYDPKYFSIEAAELIQSKCSLVIDA